MTMESALANQSGMPEKKLIETQNGHGINVDQVVGVIELIMNLKLKWNWDNAQRQNVVFMIRTSCN